VKPAPVVEWRCDVKGDACLLAAVYAAPGGPAVLFRGHRMSPAVAHKNGRTEAEGRPPPSSTIPLADLHRLGAFGPLACRHHVLVTCASLDLQQDYQQAVAEHRTVRRFLRP